MKKLLSVMTTTMLLGMSLAVGGCAATGMNDDMNGSMGTTTEMKQPAMNDSKNAMTPPTGQMTDERKKMENPTMQEAPAPMPDSGM